MQVMVRSASLTGYRALVSELGGDPLPLLALFQIAPATLDDDEGMVPYSNAIRLLQATAECLQCADFGLQLAARQGLQVLGPLAIIGQDARTVGEAFGVIGRYLHYHSPALRIAVEADDTPELRRIAFTIDVEGCPQRNQAIELTLGVVCNVLKMLSGETVRPTRVLMRHAPSLPERRYRDWFGCEVRFREAVNALQIHADVLALQIDPSQPGLIRMAQSYVESIIGQRPMSLAGQVGALIERLLDTNTCNLKQVAAHVCMHERTLQGHLMAEGLSFSILVDRVRRQRAEEYLAQKGMPMAQITGLLGYAEQSSFNKACQRWFGATPKAVRATILLSNWGR
ncbi:AraC family transcriptional regulator [Pseudomonas sp. TH41]|uniref:AraC family transcriptional regulator n=1 Tax=Pseudomonas sp. TH41 TaxID=2796405 RepID=UPI0019131DAB|nr:AraC family transcriptional regulator [Pseudomonas sp. TH41]MBK5356104.1 AraC family transcriptional regulator [Pseudomonas sp. TH41]